MHLEIKKMSLRFTNQMRYLNQFSWEHGLKFDMNLAHGFNDPKSMILPESLLFSMNELFFDKKIQRFGLFNWTGKVKVNLPLRHPVTREFDRVIFPLSDANDLNLKIDTSQGDIPGCLLDYNRIVNAFEVKTNLSDINLNLKGDFTISLLIDMSRSMLDNCKVLDAAHFVMCAHSYFSSSNINHQIIGFKTAYIDDIDDRISKISKSALNRYGRKSATVHYIFKELKDAGWDSTRLNLLLKGTNSDDIESNGAIDSEAIIWSINRIARFNDKRIHLVLVLNDGQPNTLVIDEAPEHLLSNQTKNVIEQLSGQGCLVIGVGVGNVDLSGYYKHHVTVNDTSDYSKIIHDIVNFVSF